MQANKENLSTRCQDIFVVSPTHFHICVNQNVPSALYISALSWNILNIILSGKLQRIPIYYVK